MRPLSLRLMGFRSYRDETVDFRHHGLVVISGDTGAGKTSILDGVSFALFGRTPELGGARELLTLGEQHGEVTLTFAAGGRTWRVTRRYGRDAAEPAHLLEQLDDGEVIDRAVGAAAVNAHIVQLVGMTFQAFTSAVLLAQGRFAQFLQSAPKERDAILRELFGISGLEAVRTAAIAQRDARVAAAAALDAERARLGVAPATGRNRQARAVRAAAGAQATLQQLRPLAQAATDAGSAAQSAREEAARLRDALDELGSHGDRRQLLDRHREVVQALDEARTRRDDAQRSLEDAHAARDELRTAHGGTATELAALRAHAERAALAQEALPKERAEHETRRADLRSRRDELTAARTRLGVATTAHETRTAMADALARTLAARDVATQATEALAAARAARDEAQRLARVATEEANVADAAMDELRHAHLTERLRGELEPGGRCPVCGQVVDTPPPMPTDDLDDLESDVGRLQQRAEDLALTLGKAEGGVRAAELHDATARTAAADAAAMLRAVGGANDDDHTVLDALRRELADLDHELVTLRPSIDELSADIERESGSLEEAARRMERDEGEVRDLATRLGPWSAHDDPVGALTAAVRDLELLEQSVLQSTRYVSQAGEHVSTAEAALTAFERGALGELRQALTVLATRLAVDAPSHELAPADLVRAADTLASQASARAVDATTRAAAADAQAAELRTQIATLGAAHGVHDPPDLEPRLRDLARTHREATEELARTEQGVREARRLASAADGERAAADLAAQVAVDLQANRFPRFLLSRFHERLAQGATSRLLALSHGAFSFTGSEPDHLAVVDHRRGHRVRSAATLSGGERFLASLSLALALADIASGAEGRLECLFLDEGFSSLDADSLELAISGVERMADDGRLVVIITHLPGVAERLGAAIHVRKDPGGASHVIDLVGRERQATEGAAAQHGE